MIKKITVSVIALLLAIFSIKAGTITLTSPNGGEVWAGCTQKTISWTATATSNNYTIDYTTDGGVSWISVTSSLYITSGTYSWIVPNINSTSCKIRIIDSNSPTTSDLSDNTFSITAPLLLLSPNGGESWQAGSNRSINWLANGTSNYYNIMYSTNAGTSWTSIVSNQYISNQTYNWTVPNVPSAQCLVKIMDYSNTSCMVDITDNLFTITPPTPIITVTSPNGGNTLYAGNSYSINWTSSYVTSNLVKIEYTIDNGNSWTPIVTSTSNSGSYNWLVPSSFSANCLIKITDLSNPNTNDVSNSVFTIAPPFISLTTPNGSENWVGCASQSISWTSGGTSGSFGLYYSINNGASWNFITNSSSSSYTWNPIPNLTSTTCLVKVQDNSNVNLKDSSDVVFTINQNTDIIITNPNGGEQWEAGTNKTIDWVSATSSTNFSVYYSINNGSSWSTIISNTYSKTINWSVPNSPTSNALIKVVDYSNSCKFDLSNANFTITNPTPVITVSYPNTNITTYSNNTINIQWSTAYVTDSYVKIEFSSDNGNTWSVVANPTENDGTHSWILPNISSLNCKFRISAYSNNSIFDESDVAFKVLPPFITVTSPNGGEQWKGCSSKTISWTSGGTSGSFGLYYSINNGANWNYIAGSSSSSYTWSQVADVTTSNSCLIKVQDNSNANIKDSSDVVFTLIKNNDIIVTSPNGGESWEVGTSKTISWVSEPTTSQYRVYYSTNAGSSWNTLTTSTYSASYSWTIPNNPNTTSLVKVQDYANSCIQDVSNANFTISPPQPYITVSYPNTNLTTYANNSINIQWTSGYLSSSFVKIEFSSDNGNIWSVVANPTENDGTHSWILPNINSQNCKFRISEYNNPIVFDESDVVFKVLPPFITVTSPNGGEQWKGCSSKTISWTSGGTSGSFGLYYSINNGASWNYIAGSSSSSYTWSQVADVTTSNSCLIKVQDNSNATIKDSSDVVFTLIKNNDIIVTSPNGGESWEVGTSKTISWVSEPTTSQYRVYYSINAGSSWNTLTTSTYSASYSWTIPNTPNTTSLVKVQDYANSCIQDVSNANFTIAPPQPYITVTYPNTGVTTYANNTINIQWTSGYLSSSFVKIEFSSNNGSTWTTVAEPTENDGTHSWILPNINSQNCKFRISEYNNPIVFDESDVAFKVLPPFITVTSPNGGEQWKGCSSKTISWTSGGTSGSFGLYYSINNGASWNYIAGSSSSSYTWSQVADVTTSNSCLIKVQDNSNATIKDSSDVVFTLKQNDDIIINSPNGGEMWQAGSSQNINWVAAASSTRYLVYYSTNNGANWNSLTSYQYNQYYNWTIPNSPSTNCLVKVVDYDNSCIKDISNANFSIIPGTPLVTAPNGGESLYYGSTYNISWTSEYFYATYVSLSYSVDSGATWLPIVSVTNNSGSYSWNVPNNFSAKCLVKVNEYNNPSNFDISNAIFSIKPGLVITSPNGDNGLEEWRVCTQTTIKWNSGGGSGSYKIEYSINNGQSWSTIVSSYSSSGSNNTYDWTIPNTPSAQCLIKVTDNSYPIKTDISDATFTITPAIVINTPNGGESLQPGTNQIISWTAIGSSSYYSIDYSTNGGSTWTNIVYNQNIPANSYNWLVPVASSSNCLVRVTDFINSCKLDKSDNSFAIGLPAPTITISNPNGGETLIGCSTQNINWTSSGTSGNFFLEYTADSGLTWNTIISNLSTLSGTFAWNVPNITSNKCKIRIKDANNWSTVKISTNFFSINQSVTASITAGGSTTFCSGANVILTSSSTSGNVWYPGGQTTQSITVSSSGVYYVTVTNSGCAAVSNSIGVTANPLPSAPVASSNSPVAVNTTLQLWASTIPNASYLWTGPNGFTSVQQNPSISNATTSLNGVYSVKAIVNTCQSSLATVTVSVSGVANNVAISGYVKTENNYLLNNVKLKLSGSGADDSLTTTSSGAYNFNVLQGNAYTITPSKGNDIAALSGLSTLDLILIQRHILNIQPLNSAYKVIAADVNQSGSITNMDILLIKSLILQMSTNFPGNEIWKFVNSDFVFTNPQQPFPYEKSRSYSSAANLSDQNFVAIKLGDVNNSWNPNTTKSQISTTLNFGLADQNANTGDIISIPVKVSNFNNISGFQFTMNWNPNDFEFVGVDNNLLTGNYGTNHVSSGKITALWSTESANGLSLADGSIVFTLKLKVINQSNASSQVEINSAITVAEAYNSNLDQLTIVTTAANIAINSSTSVTDINKESYYLMQNSPNPFSENTVITFNLPENQKVSLVIYNLLGEEVYNFSGNYNKGTHSLNWNGKNQYHKALSNGNYLLKMQAGDFTANRKLILIR